MAARKFGMILTKTRREHMLLDDVTVLHGYLTARAPGAAYTYHNEFLKPKGFDSKY